jgi:uncharacterized protein (TIGR02599 family)
MTVRIRARAFTLVELMVGLVVLIFVMSLLFQVMSSTTDIWKKTTSKVGTFQAARAAFESMTRNLSQATLQTYFGYADASGASVPLFNPSYRLPSGMARDQIASQYLRSSELHFLSGPAATLLQAAGQAGAVTSGHAIFFQAPLGFAYNGQYEPYQGLLTVCGYFVEFGDRSDLLPAHLGTGGGFRYRLIEVLQPAERNAIYDSTNAKHSSGAPLPDASYDLNWVRDALADDSSRHVVAENIILLLFLPKLAGLEEEARDGSANGDFLTPDFNYDSRLWEKTGAPSVLGTRTRNQLPPIVEVIMVAMDERSAQRLAEKYGSQPPLEALGLTGLFQNPAQLHHPDGGDLKTLETALQAERVDYRIFQSDIQIQGAKWSDD